MSTYKVHGRSVNTQDCPVVEASKFIGDFWNIWIIRLLLTGSKRFSEIQQAIPTINKVTLVTKLKLMIEAEIVEKTFDTNLKINYGLTEKGMQLKKCIEELEKFARDNF